MELSIDDIKVDKKIDDGNCQFCKVVAASGLRFPLFQPAQRWIYVKDLERTLYLRGIDPSIEPSWLMTLMANPDGRLQKGRQCAFYTPWCI
jgi:hypothetical protein